jgi:hypothetical protein
VASLRDADLQLELSATESQKRILKAQRRLLALRLQLGGLIGGAELGPPLCVLFEGWDGDRDLVIEDALRALGRTPVEIEASP